MSSTTTQSSSHSHALHVIIPTSSAPRAPSESTPKTSTSERVPGPNPLDTPSHSHALALDTPSHSHALFALPLPADTPTHSHNFFRRLSAATPTTPKMSVRAARRSSLFSMHDADEPEQDVGAAHGPEHVQQGFALLPPTSETEEGESGADLGDLKVVGDREFHVEGDGIGGNN
ncbi:hypothetical protein GSI_12532 [Ganoderma sinense ZZ0214-1]|uniref:Uncharacterized protein n=1 Tax=Ganoderma sinense ZZ0214-1 TaxID=1077348 RepID=A0A2G8RTG6_9APHY|nr:hypothetical protein GSI_12532 [Ganoderma sinense ZZ0214-1]